MKITVNQLKKLVNEELNRMTSKKRINEGYQKVSQEVYDCDPSDLLAFAKAWQGLGWAVQEQFERMLDQGSFSGNPNALKVIERELEGFNGQIDDLLKGDDSSEENFEQDQDLEDGI